MEKEKLLYDILTAVPNSRSITEVAKKLYISQPYISQTLRGAEERYSVKLVQRDTLPISLTIAGETLIRDLSKVIEAQNTLEIDLNKISNYNQSSIRIAFNQPWVICRGSELAIAIQKLVNNTKFSIMEHTSNVAENKLVTQEIDIFAGKMFNNPELVSNFVYRQRLFFVIPESSSLYEKDRSEYLLKKTDLKKLDGQDFISLTADSFFQHVIDHMFSDNGVNINNKFWVSNTLTATQMAVDGIGITVSLFDTVRNKIKRNKPFNLVEIPKELLRLDMGISYSKSANDNVIDFANSLEVLLRDGSHTNDGY